MQTEELVALVKHVQSIQCETQTLEVKAAHKGCPTKLFATLSSFSNQDDGGILLFGLDEESGFLVVGVYNAQDLQKKITEQCKQMQPVVRALFTVAEIENRIVVSAEIPAVDISERPVHYRGVGRIKGSYIRVGESDEQMSEYEIYSYDAFRKRIQDDLRVINHGKLDLFDKDRLALYLSAVKNERKNLADSVSDDEILELMGVTVNGVPTLAGILSFSIYPQAYFPQLCITAVSIPGTQIGETGTDHERFIDNQRITGSIPDMIDSAVDFVRRNSRNRTIIDHDGKRRDKTEYPITAVREAILNALVHRDYSIHTQNIPIRMEMYRDRMQIINSGGLYGKITINFLGKVHPDTRNASLVNILELLHVTENRYSGIPTIRRECEDAGLPAPVFEVYRGEFKVIFKNDIYESEIKPDFENLSQALLEFCTIPRTRAELIEFTGFSRNYTMTKLVQTLLENGTLKMTMPDKPKSSKQTYVKV